MANLEQFPKEMHGFLLLLEAEILSLYTLEEAIDLKDLQRKLLPLTKLLNKLMFNYIPDCANDDIV